MIQEITNHHTKAPKEKDEDTEQHDLNEDDEVMDDDTDEEDDDEGYDILPSNGPGLAGDDGEQVVNGDEE